MNNLKCTTNNCQYHLRNKCTAAVVDFNEKGVCKTKLKRDGGAYAQAVAEFELSEELQPSTDLTNILQCDCKLCQHNDKSRCTAPSVLVGDALIKTKCFTKSKK